LHAFERGCDGGDRSACWSLGDLYRDGRGTKRDLGRALGLYDRACDADLASACKQAGNVCRDTGRTEAARLRYDKACRLGDREACHLAE